MCQLMPKDVSCWCIRMASPCCTRRRRREPAMVARVAGSMLILACMPSTVCRSPWEVPSHGWCSHVYALPHPILGVHSLSLLLSAAVSRLYVRILRPDKKCCTLQRRPGAAIQVRHRAQQQHAVARKSCTQCATIANERFVTPHYAPNRLRTISGACFVADLCP